MRGPPAAAKPTLPHGERGPPPPPPAPPTTDDIPFEELSLDGASAFLYAALLPEEVLALVKKLGLGQRGFRPEALGEVERCDLLAEELRAHAPSRAPLLVTLQKGLKEPAFSGSSLDPAAAEELLEVAGSDHGLAIALWRLLCDPQPEVRARAAAALERLAAEWYGPGPAGEPGPEQGQGSAEGPQGPPPAARPRPGPPRDASGEERVAEAERRVRSAEDRAVRAEAKAAEQAGRAEEQRLRGEAQREKLQQQLKEARAEAARATDEAARSRAAAEQARSNQARAEAGLAAARGSDAAAEVVRLKGLLRDAEVARHAAEGQAARAAERLEAMTQELEAAKADAAQAAGASPGPGAGQGTAAGAAAGGDELEETPATWLLPVFSAEFYASLAGWDRRIQRAALKQAFLLSQDWRHPSLRAIALEGLPGYYRVRVATDVRLIYRRGERQDTVELCSLIDREDLDRYVRQAKTR